MDVELFDCWCLGCQRMNMMYHRLQAALEAANRAEAEARAVIAAAAQEAASLTQEAGALAAAVPQLLQACTAWAQQHLGALGVLRWVEPFPLSASACIHLAADLFPVSFCTECHTTRLHL